MTDKKELIKKIRDERRKLRMSYRLEMQEAFIKDRNEKLEIFDSATKAMVDKVKDTENVTEPIINDWLDDEEKRIIVKGIGKRTDGE